MYVRWKRRALKNGRRYHPDPHLLSAYLVESRRVDGKPRQRILAYLGSINERFLDATWQQRNFWLTASQKLEALDLSKEERAAIDARLQAVVPRLTQDELEAAVAASQEALRRQEAVIARRRR